MLQDGASTLLTQAPAYHGNSGGPVFDAGGEVRRRDWAGRARRRGPASGPMVRPN